MKFKNLTKTIIFTGLLSTQAFAIENVADYSTHSYGMNHVSVAFTPSYLPDETGYGAGLSIHSKTSLKNIHYKSGEFFWDGSVSYAFMDKSSFDPDYADFKLDLRTGLGYSSNLGEKLLGSVGVGVGYLDYTLDASDSSDVEDRYSSPYVYLEGGIGLETHNMIGVIYRLSYGSFEIGDENESFLKHNIKAPIHFNYGRNASFVLSPEIEYMNINNIESKRILLNLEVSWLYR